MGKLSRVVQKIFGATGGSSEFAQIGSLAAASPAFTKDLATIQSLAQYARGLFGITNSGAEPPRLQDINALYFLLTSQQKYIFQMGVPEYHADEDYYIGSLCQIAGTLYVSLSGTDGSPNTGNDPTSDAVNWRNMDSFYRNAGNLNAGIIPLARIPAELTGKNAATATLADDAIHAMDADTIGGFLPSAFMFGNKVLLTSGAGNWTVPDGIHKIRVTCVGGGGHGGAGGVGTGGGGGGGGGGGTNISAVIGDTINVIPGSAIAYSVGAASMQSTFTGATAGLPGANGSNGLLSSGGAGGAGPAGGAGSAGGCGGAGSQSAGGSGGGAGGKGGSASVAGSIGGYGGGGGGGGNDGADGGAGGPGIIIIEY